MRSWTVLCSAERLFKLRRILNDGDLVRPVIASLPFLNAASGRQPMLLQTLFGIVEQHVQGMRRVLDLPVMEQHDPVSGGANVSETFAETLRRLRAGKNLSQQ